MIRFLDAEQETWRQLPLESPQGQVRQRSRLTLQDREQDQEAPDLPHWLSPNGPATS